MRAFCRFCPQILKVVLLLFSTPFFSTASSRADHHAKLILIDAAGERFELSGRQCHGGVYLPEQRHFTCVCVSGVWGLYSKYCETPMAIVAGLSECFKIPETMRVAQMIIFGNPDYPFDPVIAHFRQDYALLTNYYALTTSDLDLDAASPFITILSHDWELESDTGLSLCLSGSSGRKFCYYHAQHWNEGQVTPWNFIVRINKGCRSGVAKQYETNCLEIPWNKDFPRDSNGREVCHGPELLPFPNNTRADIELATEMTDQILLDFPESLPSSSAPPPLIDFPTTVAVATTSTPRPTQPPIPILIDFPDPSEFWLEPYTCPTGVAREDVKLYWTSDEVRDCPKDLTDAVFTNQLQRLAVKKIQAVFGTRTESFVQIETLLNLTTLLMSTTCPKMAVSYEFLAEVSSAFRTIIEEDFLYGVEELEDEDFQRFVTTLQNCVERATPFNFTIERRRCNQMELTDRIFENGSFSAIEVPEDAQFSKFEPIIESVWKIFLNAHAYCYEDFDPVNDHHHFATFFFTLFSETVYEKWISPLNTPDLYKFVLPSTKNLTLTLNNLDYCVGATNLISQCQTWLDRGGPEQGRQAGRKKRSVWDLHLERARSDSRIWNGLGHCLQSAEEPAFKLGYAKCSHPVK